jgi:hypothetical protein
MNTETDQRLHKAAVLSLSHPPHFPDRGEEIFALPLFFKKCPERLCFRHPQ